MAKFMGTVQGSRGMVHRLGHESRGIAVHAKSWELGVKVNGYVDSKGKVCFDIYKTAGSNGRFSDVLIKTIKE